MPISSRNPARKKKVPFCYAADGILEPIRLMAEHGVKQVLVLSESKSVVGAFRFEGNRITYTARNG